jgi:predicted amidohydrolase YtcJ
MSIQAAVTRSAYTGADIVPGQAISVGQALLLYTGRARTVTDFGDVGWIVPGAEASFITLDQDLFRIEATRIIDTRVIGTWIRGEKVFERPADATREVP